MRRMLSWLIIWTTHRTSGLWGQLLFLRYAHMDMDMMWRAKVHATTNIMGVLMSRRARLQWNCTSMMAQMLAKYARKCWTLLIAVLVVIVVHTLLTFSHNSLRSSSASRS